VVVRVAVGGESSAIRGVARVKMYPSRSAEGSLGGDRLLPCEISRCQCRPMVYYTLSQASDALTGASIARLADTAPDSAEASKHLTFEEMSALSSPRALTLYLYLPL
jgi:hypothetical protein